MCLTAQPLGNAGGYSYLYAVDDLPDSLNEEVICIDDTQGFDGVRYYHNYVPTLRSQRSGLKVAYFGTAMRGRYNSDGKTEQKIEVRDDELSNAITTVQKDILVVEKRQ